MLITIVILAVIIINFIIISLIKFKRKKTKSSVRLRTLKNCEEFEEASVMKP